MNLSVFDLFKVGIGPSSSHTVGPMRAARLFAQQLHDANLLSTVDRVTITLYGSLSATGIGHATDSAIQLGLMGYDPENIDTNHTKQLLIDIDTTKQLTLCGSHPISFDYKKDMIFSNKSLARHPNAMMLEAWEGEHLILSDTLYSIGGGEVVSEKYPAETPLDDLAIPYPFDSADELLSLCKKYSLSVSQLMMENEKTWHNESDVKQKILHLWSVMQACVSSGIKNTGILPGGLNVPRRAQNLNQKLISADKPSFIDSSLSGMEWVNLFALAVNEENAAGSRVVTAPTNGAAGIIPAVLHYYMKFSPNASDDDVVRFFLSATAVGILCKKNASISGAEVGCQGEVGSACAMASAGLAEILGATPEQLENAAEIGLEHNLGLTCDPVGGLVQVPCIERNAIAAVKAINAAQMAMRGDGSHHISLDKVINTMKITGKDMSSKYKETSLGGLAVNSIEC